MLPIAGEEAPAINSAVLECRAAQIRECLHLTATTLDGYSESQSRTQLASAIELITHYEIEACVNLYFHFYHRHCPILHRPSFDPISVPLPLLLSVMALGGMYYRDHTKLCWMRQLLDVMEVYIHGLPGLKDEYQGSIKLSQTDDSDRTQHQFEVLQGAYLMVVVQFFSGNTTARKRAREQRFTRVLTVITHNIFGVNERVTNDWSQVARSFNLPTAKHARIISIPDQQSFQHWVRQETRVR